MNSKSSITENWSVSEKDYLPLFIRDLTMDCLGWNGALIEHLYKFFGVGNRAHKNNDLVELQLVNKVHKFGDLLAVLNVHIVLFKTVKSKLALILDQNLNWVPHELAAS